MRSHPCASLTTLKVGEICTRSYGLMRLLRSSVCSTSPFMAHRTSKRDTYVSPQVLPPSPQILRDEIRHLDKHLHLCMIESTHSLRGEVQKVSGANVPSIHLQVPLAARRVINTGTTGTTGNNGFMTHASASRDIFNYEHLLDKPWIIIIGKRSFILYPNLHFPHANESY